MRKKYNVSFGSFDTGGCSDVKGRIDKDGLFLMDNPLLPVDDKPTATYESLPNGEIIIHTRLTICEDGMVRKWKAKKG